MTKTVEYLEQIKKLTEQLAAANAHIAKLQNDLQQSLTWQGFWKRKYNSLNAMRQAAIAKARAKAAEHQPASA